MASRQYRVILLKAWTKDTLVKKIEDELDRFPREAIVSVEARVDFQFFVPWRRDWAVIVVRAQAGEEWGHPMEPHQAAASSQP
jgi:hypothetical protein